MGDFKQLTLILEPLSPRILYLSISLEPLNPRLLDPLYPNHQATIFKDDPNFRTGLPNNNKKAGN
jgi:hypothetical protein